MTFPISDFPDWGRLLQPTTGLLTAQLLPTTPASFDLGPFQVQGFNTFMIYLADNTSTFAGTLFIEHNAPVGVPSFANEGYQLVAGNTLMIHATAILTGSVTLHFVRSAGAFSANGFIWAFASTSGVDDLDFLEQNYYRGISIIVPTRIPKVPTAAVRQVGTGTPIAAPTSGAWYLFDADMAIGGAAADGAQLSGNGVIIGELAADGVGTNGPISDHARFGRLRVTTAVGIAMGLATTRVTIRYAPGP